VLGHAHAGSGHDESRDSGNVECRNAVATGTARIENGTASVFDRNRQSGGAHGAGEAGELIHRFALHPEGRQKCGGQYGRRFAREQRAHGILRVGFGERTAFHDRVK
jgi:hypothetical protein